MGYKETDECLQKAGKHEMLFVLRAQDMSSPKIVLHWIIENFESASAGKLNDAFKCAMAMRKFEGRKVAD